MKTWLASGAVILVLGAVAWPRLGSEVGAAQSQGNKAVQIVPAGQKQVGNPGEKGATYYALEAQTSRSTTRFRDGHTAIAQRGLVGDVTTTIRDRSGNERGHLAREPDRRRPRHGQLRAGATTSGFRR